MQKLTASAVTAIRAAHASGAATTRQLAILHGISVESIRRILRRDTWLEITPEPTLPAGALESFDAMQALLKEEDK